jgi:uncharacterized protein (DUF58 family)
VERYQRGVSSVFVIWITLTLVVLCLGIALIKGARHLSVLCISILVTMGGLKAWTTAGKSNVHYEVEPGATRLFPGDLLHVRLVAENLKFLPMSFEAHIPFEPGLQLASGETRLDARGTLLWFESSDLGWDLRAVRRGVYAVGPPVYETGDPLGFYVNENRTDGHFEVVVYPRIVHLRPFSLPRRLFFGTPGGESPVDDPVYILGTVDYHHSRPARYIHWKASARHNRLQQKVFEPTVQEKVLIVLDVAGFCGEPLLQAFEQTIEVVASLAAMLDRQGCAVGLVTNGATKQGNCTVPIARNPFQMAAILETLARVTNRPDMAVTDLIQRNPSAQGGTTSVYFAHEANGETDAALSLFRSRRIPVVFLGSTRASALAVTTPGPGGLDDHAAMSEAAQP